MNWAKLGPYVSCLEYLDIWLLPHVTMKVNEPATKYAQVFAYKKDNVNTTHDLNKKIKGQTN